MDIEKILQQEDAYFYKKGDAEKTPNKKKTKSKKRTSSVSKKKKTPVYEEEKSLDEILSTDDENDLRDSIINLMSTSGEKRTYTETNKEFNFSFQKFQYELNQLLIKHNFNPENYAEAEAIGLFISNLNSIAKSY